MSSSPPDTRFPQALTSLVRADLSVLPDLLRAHGAELLVLFDSTAEGVRMPTVAALGPRQRFTHKPDPLGWRDDPILAATQTAYLPDQPAGVREGWIRVSPIAPDEGGGS